MTDFGANRSLRQVFQRYPRMQPLLREINALLSRREPPTFFGWLMTTWHEVAWASDWDDFVRAAGEIPGFEHSQLDPGTVDALMWRHWHVAYSLHHAAHRAAPGTLVAAECGVGDGLTAHIAASQARAEGGAGFQLHLFDAWGPMQADGLTPSEANNAGTYAELSMARTKRNLGQHSDHLIWHPGYIPDTFDGRAPESLNWLHIDLNSAHATTEALAFFWPRMSPGSVVLFDDYGWKHYADTKRATDDFFRERPGTLMPLPTGQAIYFR